MHLLAPDEVIQVLLDACDVGRQDAMRLAEFTDSRALRDFLYQTADQYRSAAEDLRSALEDDLGEPDEIGEPPSRSARRERRFGPPPDDDVAASWERTECEALACFRDAFDMELPSQVADAVRLHYREAVARLERLRRLRARLT